LSKPLSVNAALVTRLTYPIDEAVVTVWMAGTGSAILVLLSVASRLLTILFLIVHYFLWLWLYFLFLCRLFFWKQRISEEK